MSEDTATIKATFKDNKMAAAVCDIFKNMEQPRNGKRIGTDQFLALIGNLSEEARALFERPIRANQTDYKWLLRYVRDENRPHFKHFFSFACQVRPQADRIWMEQEDLASNMAPDFVEREGRQVEISWMWGLHANLGLPLLTAVFMALGAEVNDSWVSYEDGDPLECEEDSFEYDEPGSHDTETQNIEDDKNEIEVDLCCYFYPYVEEEILRGIFSKQYKNFHYYEDKNGSNISWIPLSRKNRDASSKALNKIVGIEGLVTYANEFYEGSSFPYKWYKIEDGDIEVILDSDDYPEELISFMTESIDDRVGKKVNWYSPRIEDIVKIHQDFSLKDYFDSALIDLERHKSDEFLRHEKIWRDNGDNVISILKDKRFRIHYYSDASLEMAENLTNSMIKVGMFRNGILREIGFVENNCICGPESLMAEMECLQSNIPELSSYRIYTENNLNEIELHFR
ncbi:hypothetical protein [Isoalcanivorax indicus]|uniref:hypothetical protein n=1 Tax=Isoalcanivorax indicus TaxID=2202653 RepID=UPI000DBA285E|nr:hypothetical protein [Isoalcanivorax indicus]